MWARVGAYPWWPGVAVVEREVGGQLAGAAAEAAAAAERTRNQQKKMQQQQQQEHETRLASSVTSLTSAPIDGTAASTMAVDETHPSGISTSSSSSSALSSSSSDRPRPQQQQQQRPSQQPSSPPSSPPSRRVTVCFPASKHVSIVSDAHVRPFAPFYAQVCALNK